MIKERVVSEAALTVEMLKNAPFDRTFDCKQQLIVMGNHDDAPE
jgi:hypothetical protein